MLWQLSGHESLKLTIAWLSVLKCFQSKGKSNRGLVTQLRCACSSQQKWAAVKCLWQESIYSDVSVIFLTPSGKLNGSTNNKTKGSYGTSSFILLYLKARTWASHLFCHFVARHQSKWKCPQEAAEHLWIVFPLQGSTLRWLHHIQSRTGNNLVKQWSWHTNNVPWRPHCRRCVSGEVTTEDYCMSCPRWRGRIIQEVYSQTLKIVSTDFQRMVFKFTSLHYLLTVSLITICCGGAVTFN